MTQAIAVATAVGNGPAFSAYQSASSQSLTGGVSTKVTFDAETFDTNNNFSSSRFTPTVAGYYLLTSIVFLSSSAQEVVITFQKNGSQLTCGTDVTTNTYNSASTVITYANGSTDYFEVYCYSSVGRSISNVATNTYFNGCLLRAA
jgi:hypothetical protein